MRISSDQSLASAAIEPASSDGITAEDIATPIAGAGALKDHRGAASNVAAVARGVMQGAVADPGAAQRRMTMRLYTRMMTDLSVLTQDERLATDAEIHEALHRAARAEGLPVRPVARPDSTEKARGARSQWIHDQVGNTRPDQFVVPADQSVQTISGTGTVGDFVRGKDDPAGNSAARLSKVNAYLKTVDVRNAAYAAIEQAKRKFDVSDDAGSGPADALNRPYDNARAGYDLASLAAASRSLVAVNPDSPASDTRYLLEFADALDQASIAMSGGRWIAANPNPDFFSYNRLDYPDFNAAYQARLLAQSTQPSISALTPEMIEERQKIELDRQVLAGRNDALPSFVEQTYFPARARGASLDELQRQVARGQFLDAASAVAGAAAAGGSGKSGMSTGLPFGSKPPASFYPDYKRSSLLEVEPAVRDARSAYVGATPDKFSRTGADVVNRMRGEGLIVGEGPLLRGNPNNLQLKLPDGRLVPIDSNIDMAHTIDVVTWWNAGPHYAGAKSPYARKFMLNPNNYTLQPSSVNRSEGAKIRQVYRKPIMRARKRQ